jgi:hypothetical protein
MKLLLYSSRRSRAKLIMAFTCLFVSPSLPLGGCRSLTGLQETFVSVGPAESVLVPEKRPYSWPDGTMGLLKEADGKSYRFFAASAGFPLMTQGTLEDPIRDNIHELKIEGVPTEYQYVAGGPIYKSGQGSTANWAWLDLLMVE